MIENLLFLYKKAALLMLLFLGVTTFLDAQIYEGLSVTQCDSLIAANIDNPNFVILDVRTPGEYNPQHLEGAINRNFYDSDFDAQLDALDKNKMYLIHCKSGGRSGVTLGKMETLNFAQVYDMLGGMNQWLSHSLPTTSAFAPRLMFVSDAAFPNETIYVGMMDTIEVTITNRANSTLTFTSISDLGGTEFSTDFELNTELQGAEDYTFHIYYTPIDDGLDVLDFVIESNAEMVVVNVERTGQTILGVGEQDILADVRLFPNPASGHIQLTGLDDRSVDVAIVNLSGQPFYEQADVINGSIIDVSSLYKGIYFVMIKTKKGVKNISLLIE